jgi:hypothetical protein
VREGQIRPRREQPHGIGAQASIGRDEHGNEPLKRRMSAAASSTRRKRSQSGRGRRRPSEWID